MRLQGQEGDNFVVFMLIGEVALWPLEHYERMRLGNLYPVFETFVVNQSTKKEFDFHLDFDENKRSVVEKTRDSGDVFFWLRLDYQYFQLGTTPSGSESVRNICSKELLVKTAEDSERITIEQSKWNKILDELGYQKRLLLELPINFEEMLSSIPKHPQDGLIRRIDVASKSFQKALNELRIGKWRGAVIESRKVYEALSKKSLEDGKDVKEAIQELLLKYGLPKQNKDNITNVIENFWAYTCPTHHILDNEGKTIKEDEPTMFERDDAYLTVITAGLLIRMLAEKLLSK